MPACARPKTWLRWLCGAARTNDALAATWKQSHKPDANKISNAIGNPGRSANKASTAQDAIAS